jgi:predicted DNA-binding transcriptional regulator YafY
MRIDRLLSIVILLLNKDRIPARELADRFEVSVRTIYRDIEAINLAGIPVISYPGNTGGFGIMENFTLNRQILSLRDLIAILSALKGIRTTFDDQIMGNAIEKISSLLPRDTAHSPGQDDKRIIFDIIPYGYSEKLRQRLKRLYKAVNEHLLVEFDYRNLKGESYRRTAEPMTLLLKGSAWYLFAFCLTKQEGRLFKLTRMREVIILQHSFQPREISYKDSMMFSAPKNLVSLHLKFSPEVRNRVEEYFESRQLTYEPDGCIHAKMTFPLDEWVYSFIFSYGEDVEVLDPAHVRERMKQKAKKLYSLYNPDIQ